MSLELVAAKSRKEDIVDYLQRAGVVEISVPETTDGLAFSEFSARFGENERTLTLIENAQNVLKKYVPRKKPLTAMLEPRKDITAAEYAEKLAGVEGIVSEAKDLLEADKLIADMKAENIRLAAQAEALAPWQVADFPVKPGFTGKTAFVPGSVRKQTTREAILSYVAERMPNNDGIEIELISSDDNSTYFVFWCVKDDVEEFEQVLRDFGFVRAPDCGDKKPSELIAEIKAAITSNGKKAEEAGEKLAQRGDMYEKLEFAVDALRISGDKLAAMAKLPETQRVFYLKGFIPKRAADKAARILEERYDAAVEISEPAEDEDVPVLLTNNAFSAPLENITGMYSMPSKNDIDPTGPMAFFYYFFFGMMFSDAGYGMLMVLACGGVLLLKRNLEMKMKNTLRMYLYCGISTVFWGAIYGSWFGDAASVICREFLGIKNYSGFFSGVIDPAKELMKVMVICFIFGLVHLFTGVLMKGITDWKNNKKLDAFCDTIPTYLTILGIAPVFFNLFADVPEILSKTGTPLLIVGLVLVVLTGGREAKSIGGKIGSGLYAVYDLIGGYLGDVLSYARLLALGLATGIIAQVMNMLGVMFGSGALKAVLFVVIFIVGHIANFAINIIGTYVHTNRLQYVEFFSKFYEGGGRAFVPLSANTQYYKFAEEASAETKKK